ncbi:MAG: hypothetical protein R3F61_23750 [Myxococcota bacterium]
MLRDFLDQGDAAEADWVPHLLRLANRGDLGDGGGGLLLDLPALAQPYGCGPAACTPGLRSKTARSCCADLEVTPGPDERARIEARLPELSAFLAARDPRWERGAPEVFDGDSLRRPGRRCVFSITGPDGLRCGLQLAEAELGPLKPTACQMFPLAVVELYDDQVLLTAVHKSTARLLSSRPARVFPCLGAGSVTLAEAERPVLNRLLGTRRALRVVRAVQEWREASA